MNRQWPIVLVAVFVVLSVSATPQPALWNRTALVNTRIGSGGGGWGVGNLNPGPQVPFGAMRLGPDTSAGLEPLRLTFNDMAGYYYFNDHIECFSHTHVVGAGEGDFQNFGVMVTRALDDNTIQNCNYRSYFDHNHEIAKPGYYAVELLDPNVFAEVTVAGTHSGMHRYTARQNWPEATPAPNLLIDICHGVTRSFWEMNVSISCIKAQLVGISLNGAEYEVDAWVFNEGDFSESSNRGGIYLYLHAKVSAFAVSPNSDPVPLTLTMSTWENGRVYPGVFTNSTTTSGSLGIAFTAAPTTLDTEFQVRAGLSFISNENARLNLEAEQHVRGTWTSFDDIITTTIAMWEDHQSTISYSGGVASSDWHRAVFETALYNTARPPTTYSESNGEYLGEDWNVHTVASGERYLSDLSIWDIYRTQAPFLLWAKPSIARDLANSMMEMFHETGALPVWVFANVETMCMVGHHSAIIFADYVLKKLPGISVTAIADAVIGGIAAQNAANLQQYGYVPVDLQLRGASLTLDFALDSGAAANLAAFVGNTAAAASLGAYAQSYRNTWNNATSFFCPRYSNGTFACDFEFLPYPLEQKFTEGNGAEYRWYVPHDIPGLISLFPNVSTYADQLDEFFFLSELWPLNTTFPNWAFWAGNEPDILTPFQFLFAGNSISYLTSEWLPQLLDTYYYPDASGIPGNDDYGTMSSWVVWSYIGIYPIASTDLYGLFAPRFDEVDIRLDPKEFAASPWSAVVQLNATSSHTTIVRIRCYGRPPSGTAYVTAIRLNQNQNQNLTSPLVRHADLVNLNGESSTLLEFFLSDEATVFGEAPPSRGGPPVYQPPRRRRSGAENEAVKEATRAIAKGFQDQLKAVPLGERMAAGKKAKKNRVSR